MAILIVSNGHGEDILAARLAKALAEKTRQTILAFAMVGEGLAYDKAGIKKVHAQPLLPSGGFAYLGYQNLKDDLRAGLLKQLRDQKKALKSLRGVRLAICVGDTYNLFFTTRYLRQRAVFVPTAKSNYIKPHSFLDLLIMRKNAVVAFPRDEVTASDLRKKKVTARYLGNLMMDAIKPSGIDFGFEESIAILPGTRQDALLNLEAILRIASEIKTCEHFLVALSSPFQVQDFAAKTGWETDDSSPSYAFGTLKKDSRRVYLTAGIFDDIITRASVVIGLSGTGNEQAAGLGKPVVTFIGPGTQFTPYFARKQKKLLGDAVVFCDEKKDYAEIAAVIDRLFLDPGARKKKGAIGQARMGKPGASENMADLIKALLEGEVVF